MKINSSTHKIIVVPKSYLYLSDYRKNNEYELLPEKYWLKFLVKKDFEIFDLNFIWLLERGYLLHPPEMYSMGIPSLFVEDIRNLVMCDPDIWMCNCQVNPLNINGDKNTLDFCDKCGWYNYGILDCSDAFSYITPEKLWGREWEKPVFAGKSYFIGGNEVNINFLQKRNKYSMNRELMFRFPPQNLWEFLIHTFKGTIFSPFKRITRNEVEKHASKYISA